MYANRKYIQGETLGDPVAFAKKNVVEILRNRAIGRRAADINEVFSHKQRMISSESARRESPINIACRGLGLFPMKP